MKFPLIRPRRLRMKESLRRLVRESHLNPSQLILPLFVRSGEGVREPITAMPGQFRFSIDELIREAKEVMQVGINAILLFGIPEKKDERGSGAYAHDGIVQRAVRSLKETLPDLLVITDVCLCQYTSHGHCGVISPLSLPLINNDASLELISLVALSHARAGADLVAPSDMMDGRVAAIRRSFDQEGFQDLPILSYAVKYASSFYGPFREAAGSAPQRGDRRSYQMDPANLREALREAKLDEEEGADILMVKPALPSLDVIRAVRESTTLPVAAYQVSAEYAMIKAAAQEGWIDEKGVVMESLTAIRRAGADLIVTYFAKEAAGIL